MRIQQGYTQENIAEILNSSKGQVTRYESENSKYYQEIPVRHIITLAKLYNVSADFLLGLTDIPDPYPRSENVND
ncbi:MAG: helix-turn-helix transcriptional regulator [Ruminococcaceae bacterium]|nr:helix-turn-helix transcriptional regulator [Oscillospiraceae bacterium]